MGGILPTSPRRRAVATLAAPLVLLALLVGALVVLDPASRFDNGAPPVEELAFERTVLEPGRIILHVRNAAATENTIEQVIVDDAYWLFTMEPGSRTLGRYEKGVITVEYPWVDGEAHLVVLLTSSGTVFEHEIPVAVETPRPTAKSIGDYALIGIVVGVLPVVVGMAFFPALRRAADRHYNAVLALTLGVLAFLLVDTVIEGFELAAELPASYRGTGLLAASALVAVLAVLGLERAMRGRGSAAATAILIAVAIGVHNMGEGLLIGSAFALGSLTLGTTLIAGFALHNVTEGPAIVSPLARGGTLPLGRFILLAALAGVPTVFGAWMGAFATTSIWSVVFFGLGAGAIIVVLLQVGGAMRREGSGVWAPMNLAAFALGFLVMAATALLVG